MMKYKLYKAIDNRNGKLPSFLVEEQRQFVAVGYFFGNDELELESNKRNAHLFEYDKTQRFKDAIDPVLIGEFEV